MHLLEYRYINGVAEVEYIDGGKGVPKKYRDKVGFLVTPDARATILTPTYLILDTRCCEDDRARELAGGGAIAPAERGRRSFTVPTLDQPRRRQPSSRSFRHFGRTPPGISRELPQNAPA